MTPAELRALLREAMEILTDPDLRPEYDRSLGILSARPPVLAEPEPEMESVQSASF